MTTIAREFVILPNAREEATALAKALVSALWQRSAAITSKSKVRPRVMVWHGFLGHLAPWLVTPLKRGIEEAGFTVVDPPLGFWDINFTKLMPRIGELIDTVREMNVAGSVGHSMGGLISLLLAEILGIVGANIGSPVRGTRWRPLGFAVGKLTGLDLDDPEVRDLRDRLLANASNNVLVVWGRNDRIASRGRCVVPGAKTTSKPGGHLGVVGNERTVRAVVDHLKRHILVP